MKNRLINVFLITSFLSLAVTAIVAGAMLASAAYRKPSASEFIALPLVKAEAPAYSDQETKADKFAKTHVFRVLIQRDGEITSTGTGFLVWIPLKSGKRRVIVTAKHVCDDSKRTGIEQNGDLYAADVIAVGTVHDVCFLSVSKLIQVKDAYQLDTSGRTVYPRLIGLGYPLPGLVRFSLSSIGVEAPFGADDTLQLYMRGHVFPGQSGGPVVDTDTNKVVGVIRMIDQRFSYAVPVPELLQEARNLLQP